MSLLLQCRNYGRVHSAKIRRAQVFFLWGCKWLSVINYSEIDGAVQPEQQSEEPTDWDDEDVTNDGVHAPIRQPWWEEFFKFIDSHNFSFKLTFVDFTKLCALDRVLLLYEWKRAFLTLPETLLEGYCNWPGAEQILLYCAWPDLRTYLELWFIVSYVVTALVAKKKTTRNVFPSHVGIGHAI